jgi:periplasmic copper chaperone A
MTKTLSVSFLTLALWFSTTACMAHEYYARNLKLVHPWAEPSAQGDTEAFVYFSIEDINAEDTLLSVTSPLAEKIEFRSGNPDDKKILSEIQIAKGPTVIFELGKTYLHLKALKAPLQWARSYPMTFIFKRAGPVNTMVSVGAH